MAAETRGVFTLKTVRNNILNDEFVTPDEAFFAYHIGYNTGYFGGGIATPTFSTMDKVTYSSDTTAAVPGASLSVARYGLAATGSQSAGYFGGGAPTVSTMDKLTYSNDTTAAVPGAALSIARFSFAATGNERFGYFAGGLTYPPTYSTVDKLTYSTDTTAAAPSAALTSARYNFAATGTALGYNSGYFCGGTTGVPVLSAINKLNFSSETTSTIPATMTAARYYPTGTGSGFAGYIGGGSPTTSGVDKLAYNNETLARIPSANLSIARNNQGATSSQSSGYFGGGSAAPGDQSTMDKVNYSTDTTTVVPGAALSVARRALAAASSRANALPLTSTAQNLKGLQEGPNFGYFRGGANAPVSAVYSIVDKTSFDTDTTSRVPSANLNAPKRSTSTSGAGNPLSGYLFGGLAPSSVSTVEKTTYATDITTVVPSAALSSTRYATAVAGTNDFAYNATGYTGGYLSTTDKTVYSTETTSAKPSLNITPNRSNGAGVGDDSAGYFTGGNPYTNTFRITYSSETLSEVPSAALLQYRYYLQATGSETAGYIAAGTTGPTYFSYIDRLDYSTNTMSRSVATLSGAKYYAGATGNSSSGYIGGGYAGWSAVDRVNYVSETGFRIPSANLTTVSERWLLNGVGSRDFGRNKKPAPTPTLGSSIPGSVPNTGYFAGGAPGPLSSMDKLNFSTSTTVATPTSANLSAARFSHSGTGNSTNGYYGGGYSPGPTSYSRMDKLVYSTDTTSYLPGGNLSAARYNCGSSTSSTAGYWVGGGPGETSITDKLTYSSDTTVRVPGANLTEGRDNNSSCTGNASAFYALAGYISAAVSRCEKMNYNTETFAKIPSANTSTTKYNAIATSSFINGYIGGGFQPGPTYYSNVDKLSYSTDTMQRTSNLSYSYTLLGATSNTTSQGYFVGGSDGTERSTVSKLTFSTDNIGLDPSANLTIAAYQRMGVSARNTSVSNTSNTL